MNGEQVQQSVTQPKLKVYCESEFSLKTIQRVDICGHNALKEIEENTAL